MESLFQLFQMQAQILIAHAHDEETSRKRSSTTTAKLAPRKRSKNERSPATVQLPCQQSVTEHSQQPGSSPRTLCQFCHRNQPGHWCANWACRRCCSQGEYACEQHGTRSRRASLVSRERVEELRSASGMSMEDVDRRLEEMIEAAMRDAGMEAAGMEAPDTA